MKKNSKNLGVIYDITPFTLLDFPDKTACILWFAGCNMRCGYCYNPLIVEGKGKITFDEVLQFLEKRKNLLDGVVFSGGECTLHEGSIWLAKTIKDVGMSVKIDTNGSRPLPLKKFIDEELVDYLALDFKSLPKNFSTITRSHLFHLFEESLDLLINSNIPFEVRTTLHSELISEEELEEMVMFLISKGFKGNYFLQHFVDETPTLELLPKSTKREYPKEYSSAEVAVKWRN